MPRKPLPREDLQDDDPDPDRLLAVMAYVANATPGTSKEKLASAVARETGFVLSSEDAEEALDVYSGTPRKDDLQWLAEDSTPAAARRTVSAALRVGWSDSGFTSEGRRTLSSIAAAVGLSAEELSELLPEHQADTAYAPFPVIDSVSHWIGRFLSPSS